MSHVVIDGVEYAPTTAHARIGVAITTRNRPDVLAKSLPEWRRHMPTGSVLFIVDDASDPPVPDADYRFSERAGIARAKNKCLELLDSAGVEHLFLADDDAYPLHPDWWQPYADSPEPHLMHIFPDKGGPGIIARDAHHTAYTEPRGDLLYTHRSILPIIGGMDPCFGTWGHEHVDWSRRIHNAGLTTWRYADINRSNDLIRCMDDGRTVPRTVDKTERDAQIRRNDPILAARTDTAHYVEYRQQHDVVLTCWLHGPDTQRRGKIDLTPINDVTTPLRNSIHGAPLIVLSDDGTGDEHVADIGLGLYLSRWIHYYQWLRAHPDTRNVFMVDAGDVQMIRPMWDDMIPGRLYIGWEPKTVSDPWMLTNHQATILQDFMQGNHAQLLNCGVIGGDRTTILEFCHRMIRVIEDNAIAREHNLEKHDLGTDMAALNYVAYTWFGDRIITGTTVTSIFKAFETTNTWSGWLHK